MNYSLQNLFAAFVAILIAILAWFVIYKTRFGLRLRSVGEHPQAADTLGINVYLMRYSGVLLSGFLGGMGGAVFAQSIAGRFGITTIAGQGFISMAAMIFGKWNPLGAMGALFILWFCTKLKYCWGKLTNYFRNSKSLSTSTIRIDHFSPSCVLRKIIGTKSEREKLRQTK